MATGPMLIVDGEVVVPLLMGARADGANVSAMIQEKKQAVKITTHYSSALFYDKRHPRAAFGTDDKGYAYLVVIDGRFKDEADGATIYETAYICSMLGMTDAINLDGGGSTTLWTEKTGILNYPCDNKKFDHNGERSVPNLLVVY
jgi:exopolysaccharide biosynthesis protein